MAGEIGEGGPQFRSNGRPPSRNEQEQPPKERPYKGPLDAWRKRWQQFTKRYGGEEGQGSGGEEGST